MKQPKYLQLVQEIRQQIERGVLAVGQPLPSYQELKNRYQVSQSTVDKAYVVLENEGLITRRVGSGIYVSEPQAQPTTGFVGLVDASFSFNRSFQYFAELTVGVREAARESGKCVIMIDDPAGFDRWEALDGIVLCEAGHYGYLPGNEKTIFPLLPASCPCVNTLFRVSGMHSVMADDVAGIRLLISHLVELGHRRIGYMARMHQPPMSDHPLLRHRFQAYKATLRQHQLEDSIAMTFSPEVEYYRDYYSYGFEGMKLWLKNGWAELECTAMLAQNDLTAMGMIDALKDAGFKVPTDVSVVGFDNAEQLQVESYELTTVHVPLREIGREAVKTLLRHSTGDEQKVVLPVQLVKGRTSAVANSRKMPKMAVSL